jgi:hypothetical protein
MDQDDRRHSMNPCLETDERGNPSSSSWLSSLVVPAGTSSPLATSSPVISSGAATVTASSGWSNGLAVAPLIMAGFAVMIALLPVWLGVLGG